MSAIRDPLSVPCPRCGAVVGQRCDAGTIPGSHEQRVSLSNPTDHETTIEIIDGQSKHFRPKRMYHPVCSCGWSARANVAKWSASERIAEHLSIWAGDPS